MTSTISKYTLPIDSFYRNKNILDSLNIYFKVYLIYIALFKEVFSITSDVKQQLESEKKKRLKLFKISFSSNVTRFTAI